MASTFHNIASIKIAVVDPRSTQRQAITESLRNTGAENVTSFPDLTSFLSYVETDEADWVITAVRPEDKVNALQLLNLCIELPRLKHLRVSIFSGEEDMAILPLAFELGLVGSTTDGLPPGVGIEFTYLDKESTDFILRNSQKNSGKAFIPQGPNAQSSDITGNQTDAVPSKKTG